MQKLSIRIRLDLNEKLLFIFQLDIILFKSVILNILINSINRKSSNLSAGEWLFTQSFQNSHHGRMHQQKQQ